MFLMGRRVPHDNLSLTHPILHLWFLALGFAASIAIITAICGVRFRRKTSPPPPSSDPLEIAKELDASAPPSNTVATSKSREHPQTGNSETEHTTETENNEMQIKELPLPPAMQMAKDSLPLNSMIKRATSERRASFSLSLKMPRSLSVAKNRDQKEDNIKGKLKAEDPVWMKTIILGEKCVPDEEDSVIYEGKGKRISAYHPKNSSSMSISRQCSFLDPDAFSVPQPQTQTQEERIIKNS